MRFVTAGDLPGLYPDPIRRDGLSRENGLGIADEITASGAPGYLRKGSITLSAADQLAALVDLLAGSIERGALPERIRAPFLLGPSDAPPETEVEELEWRSFRDALLNARDAIEKRRQIPSTVYAGTKKIAPADFLAACAGRAPCAEGRGRRRDRAGALPRPGPGPLGTRLAAEKHIARDTRTSSEAG